MELTISLQLPYDHPVGRGPTETLALPLVDTGCGAAVSRPFDSFQRNIDPSFVACIRWGNVTLVRLRGKLFRSSFLVA